MGVHYITGKAAGVKIGKFNCIPHIVIANGDYEELTSLGARVLLGAHAKGNLQDLILDEVQALLDEAEE